MYLVLIITLLITLVLITLLITVLMESTENPYVLAAETPCPPQPLEANIRFQQRDNTYGYYYDGSNADDTLVGPPLRHLRINASNGDDCVASQYADTRLIGGDGNDRLWSAGPGNEMWGGRGNDIFICFAGGVVMDFHSEQRERDVMRGDRCVIHTTH
jgi:hypothetical protein